MVLDFTVSNFRSIRDAQTLSFEADSSSHLEDYYVAKVDKYRVLKLAAVYGSNASGKTNVLRALNFLRRLILNPAITKDEPLDYNKFALDPEFATHDSVMILNFLCMDSKWNYEVHFNNTAVSFEQLKRQPFGSLRPHLVFKRVLNAESMVSSFQFGAKYQNVDAQRDLTVNLFANRTLFGSFRMSNIDLPWMAGIVNWTKHYIAPLIEPSGTDLMDITSGAINGNRTRISRVTSMLCHADLGIVDMNLKKMEEEIPAEMIDRILKNPTVPPQIKKEITEHPVKVTYKLNFAHRGTDGNVYFDIDDESGGTVRYYELSALTMRLFRGGLLPIDELDYRLHPDLIMHFITMFLTNAGNAQLLFTIHNREFLMDKNDYRDDAIWFTDKDENGATRLYSLADFGSDTVRNSTNRFFAYKAGRLGAIPQLGPTFVEPTSDN